MTLAATSPAADPPDVARTPLAIGDPGRSATEVRLSISGPAGSPPDTVADGADLGAMHVRAASIRGLSHRHYGKPRQDSFAMSLFTTGSWLFIAVADGVGSLGESHRASAAAVHSALRSLETALPLGPDWDIIWSTVMSDASNAVVTRARLDHEDSQIGVTQARDLMATTLVVAAVSRHPLDDGRHNVFVASIGDSLALLATPDAGWTSVTPFDSQTADGEEEFQGASISALPSDHPTSKNFTATLRPGDALILMSDGIGKPLGDGTSTVGQTLLNWWSSAPELLTFAAQVGFARRSYTDDRTAVGVWIDTPTSET